MQILKVAEIEEQGLVLIECDRATSRVVEDVYAASTQREYFCGLEEHLGKQVECRSVGRHEFR